MLPYGNVYGSLSSTQKKVSECVYKKNADNQAGDSLMLFYDVLFLLLSEDVLFLSRSSDQNELVLLHE